MDEIINTCVELIQNCTDYETLYLIEDILTNCE